MSRYSNRYIEFARTTKKETYDIIIPAAGMGHRMKSYGVKALLKINKQYTIIDHQLKILNKLFPKSNIIIITGYESDKLKKTLPNNLTVITNTQYESTNVVSSIRLGLEQIITDKVLIIYGDLIFNEHALTIPFIESTVILDRNTMNKKEIGCSIKNQYVERFSYLSEIKWAQIVYFTGHELSLLKKILQPKPYTNVLLYEKCYGYEICNMIIDQGGYFKGVQPSQIKVIDVD